MNYMFVGIIGVVAGWITGQAIKGSEVGVGLDLAAGAIGAFVLVFLSRLMGPAGAAGMMMSAVIAIIGGVAAIYGTRMYMRRGLVPAPRPRRRM